ncbi:hypothetical protein JTB14_017548 [Gonioctena quinquepunctata]|nr:hypothetical protein JTB14_017548 [Gonioctena quinquepunctata]
MGAYESFGGKMENHLQWDSDFKPLQPKPHTSSVYKNLCLLSAIFAFSVGLTIGILIPLVYLKAPQIKNQTKPELITPIIANSAAIRTIFLNNSYGFKNGNQVPHGFFRGEFR